mmetsp:Transcript_5664/g.14372  ORF Transcript_5664/g.14372 Transcript_5664/m.14372 type:complete len:237 (+) Transcript_5664:193-903(+)
MNHIPSVHRLDHHWLYTFVRTKTLPPSPRAMRVSASRYVVSSHAWEAAPGGVSGSGTMSLGSWLTAAPSVPSALLARLCSGPSAEASAEVSTRCPMMSSVDGKESSDPSSNNVGVSTVPSLNFTWSRLGLRTSNCALADSAPSTSGADSAMRFCTVAVTPSMVCVRSPTLRPGRRSAASSSSTSELDVYTSLQVPLSRSNDPWLGLGVGFTASSRVMSSLISARVSPDTARPRSVP